jgi:hypothetical protein
LLVRRTSANDPRRLLEPAPTPAERAALQARAGFAGYGKHKRHPAAFGLPPYPRPAEDVSYCDEDAVFSPADMTRAPELLLRGIAAGLFGETSKKGDPGLLWSVDDNAGSTRRGSPIRGRRCIMAIRCCRTRLSPGECLCTTLNM